MVMPAIGLAAGVASNCMGGMARAEAEITETKSGLKYYDVVEGSGQQPKPGQLVKVQYTGWLNGFDGNGKKFDSSRDRFK